MSNKSKTSLNDGSKKSKSSKRNRIGAMDNNSTELFDEGFSVEMDSMKEEEERNHQKNAASHLREALANGMQSPQCWEGSGKTTWGQQFNAEVDNDPEVENPVDGTGSAKMTNEQTELNHRLLEYFARIGQSKNDEVNLDLDFVKSLLDSGADVNCTDKYKQTLLHEAARIFHPDVARFLLECGANVDQKDYLGRTPLHVASAVDHTEMVNYLIQAGANKESTTDGELQTPVHHAAKNDASESLKALIKNGCEYKTVRDYKGRTPLHLAAEWDRSLTAQTLLELDDPAPAGVKDYSGQAAIFWMIMKMPPVAKIALDQFHTIDRPNRKQFYWLTWLEPPEEVDGECQDRPHPLTAMHALTGYREYDLVTHTLFRRLIEAKWREFGRVRVVFKTMANFLFILLWTAQGVFIDYREKHKYVLPEEWWRIFLFLSAVLMVGYQIKEELSKYFISSKAHQQWRAWREKEIERDLMYAHDRWPEEKVYLQHELVKLDNIKPHISITFWTHFDWVCYASLFTCIITHLVDIFQHTHLVALLHIRLMSITIILIWLRLLKIARAFETTGPFIFIVGHMITKVFKFCFLYLTFMFPYACAFWMLFGGQKIPEKYLEEPWASNYTMTGTNNYTMTVDGMAQPNNVIFSLFRITLVDDYAYDDMKSIDPFMTDLLIGSWLALSAIVMLNLFIATAISALVYDIACAHTLMQKAKTLLSIEGELSTNKRQKFSRYMRDHCNPETAYYDEEIKDVTVGDVQKVTIQIKEQLKNLTESIDELQKRNQKEESGGIDVTSGGSDDDNSGDGWLERTTDMSKNRGAVSKRIFQKEMKKVKDQNLMLEKEIKKVQDNFKDQNLMLERFQKDMKKVMKLLKQNALPSLGRHEELDSQTQNEENNAIVTNSSVSAELNTRSQTPESQNPHV